MSYFEICAYGGIAAYPHACYQDIGFVLMPSLFHVSRIQWVRALDSFLVSLEKSVATAGTSGQEWLSQ